MNVSTVANAKVVTLTCKVDISAKKQHVWEAMVNAIDSWWLPKHRVAPNSQMMVLEPRAGGRFYEEAPGGGLLWYTVQMIAPGESIDLYGCLAARFGGPAISLLHISLSETKGVTTVTIEDSLIGGFSDEMGSQTHAGWTELFGEGLKPYVEARAASQ
jgi:hypothetical protein